MIEKRSVLFVGVQAKEPSASGRSANFFTAAKGLGFQVCRSMSENPSLLVCLDWDNSVKKFIKVQKARGGKSALVCLEPSVVIPLNYVKQVQEMFDKVIQVGRSTRSVIVPWPQSWLDLSSAGKSRITDRAIMVQSAKYSLVGGQLYSLRVKLAKNDNRIDVFGRGWLESPIRTIARLCVELSIAMRARVYLDWSAIWIAFQKPKNYRGPVSSKNAAMADYRVAVVIENCQEYMSEKLFDSLFAGCIPIYVGADLNAFGIPEALYVKADPTVESVSDGIDKALSMDYEAWHAEVSDFLGKHETRAKWDAFHAMPHILRMASTTLSV